MLTTRSISRIVLWSAAADARGTVKAGLKTSVTVGGRQDTRSAQ